MVEDVWCQGPSSDGLRGLRLKLTCGPLGVPSNAYTWYMWKALGSPFGTHDLLAKFGQISHPKLISSYTVNGWAQVYRSPVQLGERGTARVTLDEYTAQIDTTTICLNLVDNRTGGPTLFHHGD